MLRPALEQFFAEQKRETVELLLSAVRHSIRDTMKESRLAGKIEAFENCLHDLEAFAKQQLERASE